MTNDLPDLQLPTPPEAADWFTSPDTTLQEMAHYAAVTDVGIRVVLVTPGGLIVGGVISEEQFFREVSEADRSQQHKLPDDGYRVLAESYNKAIFEAKAEAAAAERAQLETSGSNHHRYVHLRDVRIFGIGSQALPLGHLRVLLSQVTGWTVQSALNSYLEDS